MHLEAVHFVALFHCQVRAPSGPESKKTDTEQVGSSDGHEAFLGRPRTQSYAARNEHKYPLSFALSNISCSLARSYSCVVFFFHPYPQFREQVEA